MRATALVSGGKDSTYSAYLAETQGWSVEELLVLTPDDPDSMLFHTPNLPLVALQADAWGKRHRAHSVEGKGEEAETRALREALREARDWVIAGAIASSYQWGRLHSTCFALGKRLYTPLWGKSPQRVVAEEIAAGLDIRLVHLAAEPLDASLLGRRLDGALLDEIDRRSRTVRRVNVAGEGGEYESLVVDAPFFRRRIEIDQAQRRSEGGSHRLTVTSARLVEKSGAVRTPLATL